MRLWIAAICILLGAPLAQAETNAFAPRELERDGRKVWLYVPASGEPSALVVVPPAGGSLLTAPELIEDDRVEHTPYVDAGFAVVSFQIAGELRGRVTPDQVRQAMVSFTAARDGVANAQGAIDLALAEVPALTGKPIFAAGHSSAANLVLALAAEEPRIRAAVAYAPVADTEEFIKDGPLEKVATEVPGALDLARAFSPVNLAPRLDVPLLLFHAEDDDVAPIAGTRKLAKLLAARGKPPQLVIVKSGGHYDSMIAQGLNTGILWLRKQLDTGK